MFQSNSNNGVSLKAYKGSSMTLLAMDLDKKPEEGTFAGFTIFYTNPKGNRNPIQNLLNFNGTDHITGSDVSPFNYLNGYTFPDHISKMEY